MTGGLPGVGGGAWAVLELNDTLGGNYLSHSQKTIMTETMFMAKFSSFR